MNCSVIPRTAPFAEEEIDLLNRVVTAASATQRAWLAGFLAGLDAVGEEPEPVAPPRAAEPVTIVYASESGNAERLAGEATKLARKRGFKPTVIDMAELDLASLARAKHLVVVASTWGEGEPPSRAARAFNELMSEAAPRLDGVDYGVLALGDTAYAQFCATGKAIDARLAALGARRILERIDCDLDFAEPVARWIGDALGRFAPAGEQPRGRVIEVNFGSKSPVAAAEIVQAEVIEHINLNSSRSQKTTIHLELAFDGAAPAYKPGDSLDLYARNDPSYVDDLLRLAGLAGDATLRDELSGDRDVTTLSLKTLESYAAVTGSTEVAALVAAQPREWLAGRQLIDLLEAFPASLSADELRSLTRPLAPRAYSIASSRRQVGEEAHLLIAAVNYESHGRARKGVASSYVAERLKKGDRIRVRLRPSWHFALPDPQRDVIMVGPGTGVAPFRAFVQERRAAGSAGRNWLFFGDRSFTHDFLYQLEWQDAIKDGVLTRLDLAFSRDRPEKVYVQHRLWQRRRDVVDWLENGAHFYVCGDAKAMAKEVRGALVRAYSDVRALSIEAADAAIAALERDRRYQQDVY